MYRKCFILCIRNADSKSDMERIVMRKTLCLLAVLALVPMVHASSFSIDLSPTGSGTTGVSSSGITPQNVFGYNVGEWHGTWESSSLSGQVGFDEGVLRLQIGAVASNNAGGNFAGLKFDMPSGAASASCSLILPKLLLGVVPLGILNANIFAMFMVSRMMENLRS